MDRGKLVRSTSETVYIAIAAKAPVSTWRLRIATRLQQCVLLDKLSLLEKEGVISQRRGLWEIS